MFWVALGIVAVVLALVFFLLTNATVLGFSLPLFQFATGLDVIGGGILVVVGVIFWFLLVYYNIKIYAWIIGKSFGIIMKVKNFFDKLSSQKYDELFK